GHLTLWSSPLLKMLVTRRSRKKRTYLPTRRLQPLSRPLECQSYTVAFGICRNAATCSTVKTGGNRAAHAGPAKAAAISTLVRRSESASMLQAQFRLGEAQKMAASCNQCLL